MEELKGFSKEFCRRALEMKGDGGRYTGYHENQYGEQWVFTYDQATRTGTVSGKDVDWKLYSIAEGVPIKLLVELSERLWIASCWMAVGGNATKLTYAADSL